MTDLLIPEVQEPDLEELGAYLRQVYDEEIAKEPRPRGGGVGPCSRYTNRDGKVTCWHSKDDYDWWIKASGQNFRLTCIQGSWSTSTAASEGTHAGGGVTDEEGDGYTQTEIIRQCKLARDRGLLAWPRFWVTSTGKRNWHMHVIDPMCPNMSAEAQAQVVEFGKGGDGLVGTNPDPLGGYGKTLIMALWGKRFSTVLSPPPTVVATTTTVSIWPNPSTRLEDVEVRGITTPANAIGSHIFKYSSDGGKTWSVFKPDHIIVSGKSLTAATHRFGGNHLVTAEFVPADKTKFSASKSKALSVTTIPVQDFVTRAEFNALKATVDALKPTN